MLYAVLSKSDHVAVVGLNEQLIGAVLGPPIRKQFHHVGLAHLTPPAARN